MVTTTWVLFLRNERVYQNLLHFSQFSNERIINNFNSIYSEGNKIIEVLEKRFGLDTRLTNKILDNNLFNRIENYLIVSKNTILEAGIEIDLEYCETEEIGLDLEDEQHALIKYLKADLISKNRF